MPSGVTLEQLFFEAVDWLHSRGFYVFIIFAFIFVKCFVFNNLAP